jgi:hypothetical protein
MTRRVSIAALIVSCAVARASMQAGLTADNASKYIGKDQWEWTVFVQGPPNVLKEIESVEYGLHPTFSPSDVKVTDTRNPQMPFSLTRIGWGVFEIRIKVTFRDGRTMRLTHMLKFVAPDTPPCLPEMAVGQERYQALQDPRFGNEVYVYVGDIKKFLWGPSRTGFRLSGARVVVFNGSHDVWGDGDTLKEPAFNAQISKSPRTEKWELAAQKVGDSLQFNYGGKLYVLSVTKIVADVGRDRISVRVCEK